MNIVVNRKFFFVFRFIDVAIVAKKLSVIFILLRIKLFIDKCGFGVGMMKL